MVLVYLFYFFSNGGLMKGIILCLFIDDFIVCIDIVDLIN